MANTEDQALQVLHQKGPVDVDGHSGIIVKVLNTGGRPAASKCTFDKLQASTIALRLSATVCALDVQEESASMCVQHP